MTNQRLLYGILHIFSKNRFPVKIKFDVTKAGVFRFRV